MTEIEQLRETNRRLNRRCQEAESAIQQRREWIDGWAVGRKSADERLDRYWQRITQKHGEKNARLRRLNVQLQKIVNTHQHTLDDHPICVNDFLWRVEPNGLVRCQIDGFGNDWINVCDDGDHSETLHLGGDGPYFYFDRVVGVAAEAAEG